MQCSEITGLITPTTVGLSVMVGGWANTVLYLLHLDEDLKPIEHPQAETFPGIIPVQPSVFQ